MKRRWSRQIETRYGLTLTPDLRTWFDDEIWRIPGGAEFCQAISPEQILHPSHAVIWAGFMLPDTLPLIGNGYGDWLCMRIGPEGSVAEIIRWSHGGGDWLPVGRTLAEALLYDAAIRVMYDRRSELGDAEPPREQLFRRAEWACSLEQPRVQLWPFWRPSDSPCSDHTPMDSLLASGAAVIAARHDRLLKCLDSRLKHYGNAQLAFELDLTWEPDFVSWIFDNRLLPPAVGTMLSRRFGIPADQLTGQCWDAAEAEATAVCQARKDLGWAWDIAAWAAERRKDLATAVRCYKAGVRTSLFSDDTVNFRTHWFPEGYGKFAAARLADLRDQLSPEELADGYLSILWENDAATLHSRIERYWNACAERAEVAGDWATAYHCYRNAGWDLGLRDIAGMDHILEGLARSASAAGFTALAHIAAVHRACLLH